jgi:enoyl-CoA hydratase
VTEPVLVSIDDGVMVITINRPHVRNAINKAISESIASSLDRLDGDSAIQVAIITGTGGVFSSGMDLKAFVAGEIPVVEGRGFAGFCEKLPRKPLIAAIEGYAVGGGCEMALCCDLIVAADDAHFGIPEVKRGLVAGAGGLLRLPRQIPYRVAMELALTGEFFSARRAYELGFINRLAEHGSALEVAKQLAAAIASNGPLAVAISKQILQASRNWSTDEMFARQFSYIRQITDSEDAIEGPKAFAEKRTPVWKGK